VVAELKESIEIAKKAGVKDSQIILDPGVGFGKTYEQNLSIIQNVDKLQALGYPVLLGTSRKSVIGLTLDVDRDDRMAGTVATTVMGLERGCRIFRVHDVKENYQAMMMTEKILKS
jgi:dihydropteroate synthase